jgi:hypothetical protein
VTLIEFNPWTYSNLYLNYNIKELFHKSYQVQYVHNFWYFIVSVIRKYWVWVQYRQPSRLNLSHLEQNIMANYFLVVIIYIVYICALWNNFNRYQFHFLRLFIFSIQLVINCFTNDLSFKYGLVVIFERLKCQITKAITL